MDTFDSKTHWENIYKTKQRHDFSWYQPIPATSLQFISERKLQPDAKIIDIGGGDSFLADELLKAGYKDITVLDISETALDRAKLRLGVDANKINGSFARCGNIRAHRKI